MKLKLGHILLIMLLFTASCSPSYFVKPLTKDQNAAGISLGGPLIKYSGATIPIPFLTATYGRGLRDDLTAFGGLNLTSLAYGTFHTEFGVVKGFLKPEGLRPGLSVTPAATFAMDFYQFHPKLWPRLEVNAYWNYRQKGNYFYFGANNWFELAGKRAFDVKQPNNWLLTLQAGHVFENPKMNYIIELKYNAINANNQNLVVDYAGRIGNTGALGVYFGVVKKF